MRTRFGFDAAADSLEGEIFSAPFIDDGLRRIVVEVGVDFVEGTLLLIVGATSGSVYGGVGRVDWRPFGVVLWVCNLGLRTLG